MDVKIRIETPADIEAIARVNTLAFGSDAEARLVSLLRQNEPKSISLVAVARGDVVGHVMFSPMTVQNAPAGISFAGLGPLAVLPAYQDQGIGGKLIEAGLKQCRQAGYSAVAVLGKPDYYVHFGFVPAEAYDIECEFEVPRGVFQVQEIKKGTLSQARGCKLFYRPEFRQL